MKKTYTQTFIIRDLTKATFILEVFEEPKYIGGKFNDACGDQGKKVEYKGVRAWSIITGGDEAEEIERDTDQSGIDENHEYLVLYFEDGNTATFRNSHIDMWIRK